MKRGTSGTNAQCVLSELPVRKARPQARRHEHRKPRRSFRPTGREADGLMPGLLDSMPGAVAIAQACDSESSAAERRSERATPEGVGAGSTAGS